MSREKVIVHAIFRGEDGSLGYEKDRQYLLLFRHDYSLSAGSSYHINTCDKETGKVTGGACEYSGLSQFFENWSDVTIHRGSFNMIETRLRAAGISDEEVLKHVEHIQRRKK